MLELASAVREASGGDAPFEPRSRRARARCGAAASTSPWRAAELGWEPRVTLAEGLRATLAAVA